MKNRFSIDKVLDCLNIVFFLFTTNLFFLFLNIPMVLFVILVGVPNIQQYFPLFLTCLLPVGPSLAALFYCMHKLILFKDCPPLRLFFKSYKQNFRKTVSITLLQLFIAFIWVSNIKFFVSKNLLPFTLLFWILCGILVLCVPYTYLLIIRFKMSLLQIIKASVTLVFTHPVFSIGNVAIFLFILMLFEITPGTTVLFFSSIYSFLIVKSNQNLLKTLEDLAKA